MKVKAPFKVTSVDEPRYGRFYFLEAFSIVRTLYLADNPVVSVNPPVARVERKTFRWGYRILMALPLPWPPGLPAPGTSKT